MKPVLVFYIRTVMKHIYYFCCVGTRRVRTHVLVFPEANDGKDTRISDSNHPTLLGLFRWGPNLTGPTLKGEAWRAAIITSCMTQQLEQNRHSFMFKYTVDLLLFKATKHKERIKPAGSSICSFVSGSASSTLKFKTHLALSGLYANTTEIRVYQNQPNRY